MVVVAADTVLPVIDVQEAFDDPVWGARNNTVAEANIGRLLAAWRAAARPVIHVRHRSEEPGELFFPEDPGFAIKAEAEPLVGEPLLVKTVNSAFIGTDLEERLRRMDATRMVVVGLTTDHCVSTTARMAANLGFECLVVTDATATFERRGPDGRHWSAQDMHDSALASLNDEFAEIVTTAQLLAIA